MVEHKDSEERNPFKGCGVDKIQTRAPNLGAVGLDMKESRVLV